MNGSLLSTVSYVYLQAGHGLAEYFFKDVHEGNVEKKFPAGV